MAYRNGTYVAFHANDTSNPVESDMKYYALMKGWKTLEQTDFDFIDAHAKGRDVRDSSKRSTLEAELKARLRNSRNMVLILGKTTRNDTDWVPMEIEYAVDVCEIPIIAAYTGYQTIVKPSAARELWPKVLAERIDQQKARVIHIAFKQQPLAEAVKEYDCDNLPEGALTYYTPDTYTKWGL